MPVYCNLVSVPYMMYTLFKCMTGIARSAKKKERKRDEIDFDQLELKLIFLCDGFSLYYIK